MSSDCAAPNRYLEFWRLLWTTETTAHVGSVEKEALFDLYKSKHPDAKDTYKTFVSGLSAAVRRGGQHELVEQRVRNKAGKQVRVWVITEAFCPPDLVEARRQLFQAKEEEQAVATGLLPTGATCKYPSAEWDVKWYKPVREYPPPGTCHRRPISTGYCVQHHYLLSKERYMRWYDSLKAQGKTWRTEATPAELSAELHCGEVITRAQIVAWYANPDHPDIREKVGDLCDCLLETNYPNNPQRQARHRHAQPDNVMCTYHGVKAVARVIEDFARAEAWESRRAGAETRRANKARKDAEQGQDNSGEGDEDSSASA